MEINAKRFIGCPSKMPHAVRCRSRLARRSSEPVCFSRAESLQVALNEAVPGDTITLQAGATFVGNFILPSKSGTGGLQSRVL